MEMVEVIGFIAGIFTTIAVLPQLIKSWQTKKVSNVSPVMFAILMIGVGLWVVYGVLKSDLPIILTNGTSFLLNTLMLILMLRYKK